MKLSDTQKSMLLALHYGDCPMSTIDGYFWDGNPTIRFNLRTANSLIKKGLIAYNTGVASGFLSLNIYLTENGKEYIDNILAKEIKKWTRSNEQYFNVFYKWPVCLR